MKKIIPLLIALLAVASCQKVVEIDNQGQRQIVLNAVPTAGQRAFVNLAYTRFFLDPSNIQPVGDPQITLRINGLRYTPDSVSTCNYFFPYTLRERDRLEIEATADGRTLTASTYVPALPSISSLTVQPFRSPSFNFMRVGFTLNDHPDTAEIYGFTIMERDSGLRYNPWTRTIDTVDSLRHTYFLLRNANEITASDVCPYIPLAGELYSTLMFYDSHIDGQQYPIDLYILQLVDTNEVQPFKHEYQIRLQSLTYERFRYLISVQRQNSMTSFFAEQGQVYTNISATAGVPLGVFAGMSSVQYLFDPDTIASPTATPMPDLERAAAALRRE